MTRTISTLTVAWALAVATPALCAELSRAIPGNAGSAMTSAGTGIGVTLIQIAKIDAGMETGTGVRIDVRPDKSAPAESAFNVEIGRVPVLANCNPRVSRNC